jgi:hypothetical protein
VPLRAVDELLPHIQMSAATTAVLRMMCLLLTRERLRACPSTMIAPMAKTTPDHHDAELPIRVYDLRRETVLRESRRAIQRDFRPRSLDDLREVLEPQHPLNAACRQVASYWEMVYSFARYGIVHPAFWPERNGEGLAAPRRDPAGALGLRCAGPAARPVAERPLPAVRPERALPLL